MLKVYFESASSAELVATFDSEEVYMTCIEALEALAKSHGMIVTESVEQEFIETQDSWKSTHALISHRIIEASEKSGTESARLRGNNGQLYLFDYIEQLTNQFEESHIGFDWESNDFYDEIEAFLQGKI
jgi:hypothetical protein